MKYYLVSYFVNHSYGFGAGHAWVSTDTVFNYDKFQKDLKVAGNVSLCNVQEVSKAMYIENNPKSN